MCSRLLGYGRDLPDSATQEEVLRVVQEFNNNPAVHGILVQLPARAQTPALIPILSPLPLPLRPFLPNRRLSPASQSGVSVRRLSPVFQSGVSVRGL